MGSSPIVSTTKVLVSGIICRPTGCIGGCRALVVPPTCHNGEGSEVAIAYRDLWNEVQTAALGRQIELSPEAIGTDSTAASKRAKR